MPFASKAQARYFYANKEKLRKQGVDVDEWSKETEWDKLPEKKAHPYWLEVAEKKAETAALTMTDMALLGALASPNAYHLATGREMDEKTKDWIEIAGLGGLAAIQIPKLRELMRPAPVVYEHPYYKVAGAWKTTAGLAGGAALGYGSGLGASTLADSFLSQTDSVPWGKVKQFLEQHPEGFKFYKPSGALVRGPHYNPFNDSIDDTHYRMPLDSAEGSSLLHEAGHALDHRADPLTGPELIGRLVAAGDTAGAASAGAAGYMLGSGGAKKHPVWTSLLAAPAVMETTGDLAIHLPREHAAWNNAHDLADQGGFEIDPSTEYSALAGTYWADALSAPLAGLAGYGLGKFMHRNDPAIKSAEAWCNEKYAGFWSGVGQLGSGIGQLGSGVGQLAAAPIFGAAGLTNALAHRASHDLRNVGLGLRRAANDLSSNLVHRPKDWQGKLTNAVIGPVEAATRGMGVVASAGGKALRAASSGGWGKGTAAGVAGAAFKGGLSDVWGGAKATIGGAAKGIGGAAKGIGTGVGVIAKPVGIGVAGIGALGLLGMMGSGHTHKRHEGPSAKQY